MPLLQPETEAQLLPKTVVLAAPSALQRSLFLRTKLVASPVYKYGVGFPYCAHTAISRIPSPTLVASICVFDFQLLVSVASSKSVVQPFYHVNVHKKRLYL